MLNTMLTRFCNTVIKNQRLQLFLQLYKHRALSTTVFKMNYMCTDNFDNFDMTLLSPEDKKKILEVINSKTTTDLLQYSITKRRAEKLESHRAKNGSFESLDDLLQLQSMNNKWVYNFYKSIICGKKKAPKKIISGLIVTPKSTQTNQKDVNTVLGIYVGHDLISWSLLNRNCEVLEWNYETFLQQRAKENIHSLFQETIPIARKLPKADRYVMQEFGGDMARIQNHFFQNFVQQSIIGTIILSYLTISDSKFNDITEFVANNIVLLRERVLQKVYGLLIDNEAISTQYMLQKLLQENDELVKTKEPKMLIRAELRNMYNAQSSICQEQIGWSLLTALAFIELIVHKRTDMILRESFQEL